MNNILKVDVYVKQFDTYWEAWAHPKSQRYKATEEAEAIYQVLRSIGVLTSNVGQFVVIVHPEK